jgi:putative tryptophan/tyrosine transport system substrate-binding protein
LDHFARRRLLQAGLVWASAGLLASCKVPSSVTSPRSRVYRIGYLSATTAPATAPNLEGLRVGMQELGYVEGQNYAIDVRYSEGKEEPLRTLAAELVALNVDVLVPSSDAATRAARQATSTIPIVFATLNDPVANGHIASLARPGGNATGVAQDAGQESSKRMDLLKEAFPRLTRVAALWNQTGALAFTDTEQAAQKLGVQVVSMEFQDSSHLSTVLSTATTEKADGVIVMSGAQFNPFAAQIVGFAAQNRLPAMYPSTTYVPAGGLMIYGHNVPRLFHHAAAYIDKILKGANPADLPVEQPTTFDFVVNLKTAQALGLSFPESILLQATEVIR